MALENHSDAILGYPIPKWVDSRSEEILGKGITYYSSKNSDILIRSALSVITKPFQLYGIIRSKYVGDFYTKFSPFIGEDNVFLYYLSLNGYFDLIKNETWSRRFNYGGENYKSRMKRYKNNLLEKIYIYQVPIPQYLHVMHLPLYNFFSRSQNIYKIKINDNSFFISTNKIF